MRARYYDPGLGRFLSRDPLAVQPFNPVEINRYVYVVNNPINAVDPLGTWNLKSYGLTTTFVGLQGSKGLTDLAILVGGGFLASYVLLMMAQIGVPPDIAPTHPGAPSPSPDGRDPLDEIRDLVDELNRRGQTFRQIKRVATAILVSTLTQLLPGEPKPDQKDRDDANLCDPAAFTTWWSFLPRVGAPRPGVDWYDYEQRVARGPGTLGGMVPRTVPAGIEEIDADGAMSTGCMLLEAKHSPDPLVRQYRQDAAPRILAQLIDEIRRYRLSVAIPNGVPGAQPSGLVLITNLEVSRPFFVTLLSQGGFTLGVNAFVKITP